MIKLSAPVAGGGAITRQLVEKDYQEVCGLSAIDPRPNSRLEPALCSRMLPHCPVLAGPD